MVRNAFSARSSAKTLVISWAEKVWEAQLSFLAPAARLAAPFVPPRSILTGAASHGRTPKRRRGNPPTFVEKV
jgi:hypothetical protein